MASALARGQPWQLGQRSAMDQQSGRPGLVWPLLGGALAARRSTRSAGAAGIAAVVVTSAVTWAIQQAVQRDRPSTLTALVTRGSARRPAASSFPSTHAANAFAFAAAAGTICPGLSVVLVPLAAAIGVARVGIAHHYSRRCRRRRPDRGRYRNCHWPLRAGVAAGADPAPAATGTDTVGAGADSATPARTRAASWPPT